MGTLPASLVGSSGRIMRGGGGRRAGSASRRCAPSFAPVRILHADTPQRPPCETKPNSQVIACGVRGNYTPSTVKNANARVEIYSEIPDFSVNTGLLSHDGVPVSKFQSESTTVEVHDATHSMTQQAQPKAAVQQCLTAETLVTSHVETEFRS